VPAGGHHADMERPQEGMAGGEKSDGPALRTRLVVLACLALMALVAAAALVIVFTRMSF
jgi:hypothetical protein